MKLFLTANTITPNLVQSFETLIGRKSAGLKAAFIPDAGLKTQGDKAWIDTEMREDLIEGLQWQANKVTLANETPTTLAKLFDYDVIYVNGGYSGYLAQVMRASGFDQLLPQLLAKGIIYVGSSAGSMVLSTVQDAASFYFGEPEPEALTIGGLGLFDFEFYPVHEDRYTPDIVEKINASRNRHLKYYVVLDGQAISIDGTTLKTYGDVVVLNPITDQKTR